MIKAILGASGMVLGPTFALVTFFSVLVLSVAWCYRPGSQEFYNRVCESMLKDGDES